MSDYLAFVREAVQTLIERQSARLGGRPDGTLCLTVTKATRRTYRSLGGRHGDTYYTYLMEEQPLEPEPYRLDLSLWAPLELLSDITGEPRYRQMVVEMARGFGRYGFDPASGLGYLGAQAEFDVIRLKPVPVSSYTEPSFKPRAGLPLERLWAEAPAQMARMFKSAYYGLVTRPETMDYNRYCPYGFSDADKRSPLAFNSQHVAFAQTGSMLIHWWAFHYARTGDAECLGWAQAMADKWQAVQHPQSGLLPHWFGSDEPGLNTMPPRPYANPSETITAICLLEAGKELRKRPAGQALASQVTEMARKLLRGIARFGYDPQARLWPEWLHLDGRVREETAWYAFRTAEQREEAAKRDPILREVPVYAGASFFRAGPWAMWAGIVPPYDITLGAYLLDDAELLERARFLAEEIMAEAAELTSAFNGQGQWTYPASASYIKAMLLLQQMTGQRRYLDWARQLADRELEALAQLLSEGRYEWWRLPARHSLLEALLSLHQAITAPS